MIETRVPVGAVEDFAEGGIHALTVGDREIVLVRSEGRFYALPDRCTHANFPLHDGELQGGALKCAHHGAKFDLATGRPTLPAVKKIRLYEVEVEDGQVVVVLQEA